MKQKIGKYNQNETKEAQKRLEKILVLLKESEKHFSEALKLQIKKDPTTKEKIDKINALVRTSEYKKDIKELESFERDENTGDFKDEKGYWKKYYEITDKYNIYTVIFTNTDGSPDLLFENIAEIFRDKSVVVLENEKFKEVRDAKGKFVSLDLSPHLFENKYLMLQVDLTKKTQEIEKAFKEIVDSYRKYVVIKTQRTKPHTIDMWQAYDMKNREKLKLSQIAKKLSGINENPAYNPEVMRQYKLVKRAIDKASKKIKEMEKLTPTQIKYIVISL